MGFVSEVLTQVSVRTGTYSITRFQKVTNVKFDIINKPSGGLWSSTYSGPDTISQWYEWLLARDEINPKFGYSAFTFDLAENSKIFEVDSKDDLLALYDLCGDFSVPLVDYVNKLDFEKASEIIDVIHLTLDGMISCSHPMWSKEFSRSLYAWDVESCLILNPKSIINIKDISKKIR
jgi:hypothetical protein